MSDQERLAINQLGSIVQPTPQKLGYQIATTVEAEERLLGPDRPVYPSFLDFQVEQMKLENKVLESKNEILSNRLRQVAAIKDDMDRLKTSFQIVYDQLKSFTSGLHGLSTTESIAEE